MLGPMAGTHTTQDPFLTSLVDYQRRVTGELAGVLRGIVIRASQDEHIKGKLGAFIDHNRKKIDLRTLEGQECPSLHDTQYLLGYLQRNCAVLANHLGLEEAYLIGIVSDLLEVRNVLAHGLYKKGSSGDDDAEEREKTDKFIQRVLDFIERIIASQDSDDNGAGGADNNTDNTDDDDDDAAAYDCYDSDADKHIDDHRHSYNLEKGYRVLLSLYGTFKDFVLYQEQSRAQVKHYSVMTPAQQRQAARETLGALQQLLGREDDEPGEVTRYIVTCVRPRFKAPPS